MSLAEPWLKITGLSNDLELLPSSTLCDVIVVVVDFVDYPGLKNAAAIEDLRRNILSAFRAYTTGQSHLYDHFTRLHSLPSKENCVHKKETTIF